MFIVEKAKQERQQKVVQAEGEAAAASMISLSMYCTCTLICWKAMFHHASVPLPVCLFINSNRTNCHPSDYLSVDRQLVTVALLISLTSAYIGKAVTENPGYLKLRKIRAAQQIARTVSEQ